MPHQDISFKTVDNVTLRGWFFRPEDTSTPLPCVVMAHGFSAIKEMHLDDFANAFTSRANVSCLVYDQRGFGDSDTRDDAPRQEILPWVQASDYSDAITCAQSLPDVDPNRIAIWGSSLAGGLALYVGAVDRRVKAVLAHAPVVDGWSNIDRNVRTDIMVGIQHMLQQDRLSRAAGHPPAMLPVVSDNPIGPAALPSEDSFTFFSPWAAKSKWKNEVTLKTLEAVRAFPFSAYIAHLAPTPLLMTVATSDVLCPTDLALEAYARALEPKRLQIYPGGHFDGYTGKGFALCSEAGIAFLREHLADAATK